MATERPAKAKRILVVEDEPMIRMLLEDMLGERLHHRRRPRYARGCCEQHVNGCGRVILKTKNDDWLGCLCMSNTAERAHEQGGKSASRKM